MAARERKSAKPLAAMYAPSPGIQMPTTTPGALLAANALLRAASISCRFAAGNGRSDWRCCATAPRAGTNSATHANRMSASGARKAYGMGEHSWKAGQWRSAMVPKSSGGEKSW